MATANAAAMNKAQSGIDAFTPCVGGNRPKQMATPPATNPKPPNTAGKTIPKCWMSGWYEVADDRVAISRLAPQMYHANPESRICALTIPVVGAT